MSDPKPKFNPFRKKEEPSVNIEFKVMEVTPKIAAEWLGKNSRNRNLKPTVLSRLVGAIERGEWRLNGETIKFNGEILLDGQHRLEAVVRSGKPITTGVVFGLPMESQETVDMGVKRSLADVLTLQGETSTATLAGSIVYLWKELTGKQKKLGGESYPTTQQALALLQKYPALRESKMASKRLRWIGLSDSLQSYLNFRFSSIDEADAKHFFDHLATGAELQPGSPILALRTALERDRASARPMPAVTKWAICVKSWNAFRRGDTMKIAVWRRGGSQAEDFPVPE